MITGSFEPSTLLPMNLLSILTILNCGFLLVYFFTRQSAKLTYTETVVARQMSAYTLTLLTLLLAGLLVLKMFSAAHIVALSINIILILILIVYFIRRLGKKNHAGP